MPPKETKGKATSYPAATAKTTKPIAHGAAQKCAGEISRPPVPALRRGTRGGLRSASVLGSLAPFQENPESILRDQRRIQKVNSTPPKSQVQALTHDNLRKLEKSEEIVSEDDLVEVGDSVTTEDSDEGRSSVAQGSQELFFQERGYLPPLEKRISALLSVMAASPDVAASLAKKALRRSPGGRDFGEGLDARNAWRVQSKDDDPYYVFVKNIPTSEKSSLETLEETTCFDMLWKLDRAKCDKPANEALFQRTLMISLVARHCLIYEKSATREPILDFSVEEPWNCPPMPTRDFYVKELVFLTSPVPDLAVGFCRDIVLPNNFWPNIPRSLKRLICYENLGDSGQHKAFHFFTIEAKKSLTSPDNLVGLHQSLNNATQALHNMFEFFQDAGHQEIFFEKVRFFSVVASNQGILIRIHRATKILEADDRIVPDYPLQFEHQEFARLMRDSNFNRENALKTFNKILHGYGEKELLPLLRKAAIALKEKLTSDTRQLEARRDEDFYLHGQARQKKKRSRATSYMGASTAAPTDAMSLGPPLSKLVSHADQSMRDVSPTSGQTAIAVPDISTQENQTRNTSKDDKLESPTDARPSAPKRRKRPRYSLSRESTQGQQLTAVQNGSTPRKRTRN